MLAQLFNQLTGQPTKPPTLPHGGMPPYAQHPAAANSASYWANPALLANTPHNPVLQVNSPYATDTLDGVQAFGASVASGAGGGYAGSPQLLHKRLPADYGVNKPLKRPMFLGYHHDKPMYVGEKLFISC